MRHHVATLTLVALVGVLTLGSEPVVAAETWTCWNDIDDRGDDGTVSVTRCRLSGSTGTTDYGSASEVPVVLSPTVGTDDSGACWYWTTRPSDWVVLGVDDEGRATMGIDPDGEIGGPLIVGAVYPVCTSEPTSVPSEAAEAYELLRRYEHAAPAVEVSPRPGLGVVGMEVLVAVDPPMTWSAAIDSPHTGRRLEVETWVSAVAVDWGDGSSVVVPPAGFGLLSGWPDGRFGHTYEQKTCESPGRPRCHPTLSAYPLTVTYVWSARYRVDFEEWTEIPVPPTGTTVDYDVDEILGVTTGVG